MRIGVQELVLRIFGECKRFFDGCKIEVIFFQSYFFAVLLVIGFAVNDEIHARKSDVYVAVEPVAMRIGFFCEQNILYDHGDIIAQGQRFVNKNINKQVTNGYLLFGFGYLLFLHYPIY